MADKITALRLDHVLDRMYASEINCSISISSFWDGGWTVQLGDEMNGFDAVANLKTSDEIAQWLHEHVLKHYPTSKYTRLYK